MRSMPLCDRVQSVIDSLIDRENLTLDEQDYLNVLGSLVRDYEDLYHQIELSFNE